jgi:hypothetical protein
MGMVIHKLTGAIYAKFGTAALTGTFGTRYFPEEAEGSPAFPYVISEVVPSAPLTDAYGNVTSADVTIIFKVIGNGHDATAANMATLLAAFDNVSLTLAGGAQINVYRTGEPIPTKLPDDETGNDVWQWSVAYTYSIQ